jgi:hypothetical protein
MLWAYLQEVRLARRQTPILRSDGLHIMLPNTLQQ